MAERELKKKPAPPSGSRSRSPRRRRPASERARSSRPSSTTCWTRSTRSWRTTPRSSSATTSRRAGSSPRGPPALPSDRGRPGPDFAACCGGPGLPTRGPARDSSARPSATAPPWSPCASPTAWSWPATAGPPRATHRPPGHGEGLPGRPLLGGGHRRGRRLRRGDGPPLPDPARALREGRGGRALAWRGRPTSWARWCASTCPWPCRAWPSSRCSPATTCARGTGPHLHLRRHRRPLRGGRLPGDRLGRARRPHHHQARLPRRACRGRGGRAGHRAPSTRRPTRTRPPAGPTSSGASSRWWPRSPRTGYAGRGRGRGGRALRRPRSSASGRRRTRRWLR